MCGARISKISTPMLAISAFALSTLLCVASVLRIDLPRIDWDTSVTPLVLSMSSLSLMTCMHYPRASLSMATGILSLPGIAYALRLHTSLSVAIAIVTTALLLYTVLQVSMEIGSVSCGTALVFSTLVVLGMSRTLSLLAAVTLFVLGTYMRLRSLGSSKYRTFRSRSIRRHFCRIVEHAKNYDRVL